MASGGAQASVRFNRRMAELLPFVPTASTDTTALDPRLARTLEAGFEEIEGCVVLSRFAESARRTSIVQCQDRTGFEAFVNHVHVEDELPDASDAELLQQTELFLVRLADELAGVRPEREFRIALSVSGSYTIRFYEERDGERWLEDDLEGYRDEAVLTARVPLDP